MEKNIVSKELKKCLDYLIELEGKDWILKKHAIKTYYNKVGWATKIYNPLNGISLDYLAKLIYQGYELEETKEEKLINLYRISKKNESNNYNSGFCAGINFALEMLEIEIDGINKK